MTELFKASIAKNSVVQMRADKKTADIYIYDSFGPSQYGLVSAKSFQAAVNAAGAVTELHVYLNTPGGSIYEAMGIYTTLKDHPAKVFIHITLAASAGTYVAMSGDHRDMAQNGIFMVHPPRGFFEGTVEEVEKDLEGLKRMRQSVNQTYADRTGLTLEEVTALVQATTWMTAEEAKKKGFVDTITPNKTVSAQVDLSAYGTLPAWCQQTLGTLLTETPKMSTTLPTPGADGSVLFTADQLDAFISSVRASAKPSTPTPTPTPSPAGTPPVSQVVTAPAVTTTATPPTGGLTPDVVSQMITAAVNARSERDQDINALCSRCGVPQMAAGFIKDPKITVNHVQLQMIDVLCSKNTPPGGNAAAVIPGQTKNDGDAKFKQEFEEQAATFAEMGVTEAQYIAHRKAGGQ